MTFEGGIKDWVILDNKIRLLNQELKEYRNEKKKLTERIYEINTNNYNNIKISDGRLKFVNTKINNTLSYKFIKKCLEECINDENKIKEIINLMKEKRDFKYVQEIKRF
tara:strand:+ start:649 stop:975 length:327 start_codon:yes stop_codon:yes gene_type:complete